MVGGLVQKEDVGFCKQQAAEGHTTALASGEVLGGRVTVRTAQGVHGAFQLRIKLPRIVLLNEVRQFALALNELVHFVVAHRLRKLHVHLLVFLQNIDNGLHALHHHLLDGEVVVDLRFLRQVSHRVARREDHLALVGLVKPGDDLQQRGFTGAVEAQHADLRSVKEGEVYVFKYLFLRRIRLADVHHGEDDFFVVGHFGLRFKV